MSHHHTNQRRDLRFLGRITCVLLALALSALSGAVGLIAGQEAEVEVDPWQFLSALVGSWLDSGGGIQAGAGYVFVEALGVWSEEAKLVSDFNLTGGVEALANLRLKGHIGVQ